MYILKLIALSDFIIFTVFCPGSSISMPTGSEAKMCVGHKQCALQNSILFTCKNLYIYRIEMVVVKIIFFYHDVKIARPKLYCVFLAVNKRRRRRRFFTSQEDQIKTTVCLALYK